jgi:pilus assembly protein CpaF
MNGHHFDNPGKEVFVQSTSVPDIDPTSTERRDLKHRVHDRLLSRLDFAAMGLLDPALLRAQLAMLIMQILEEEGALFTDADREEVITDVMHEVLGLGPLEPLLQDPTISDILVNTFKQVYVERGGKLELAAQRFNDNTHLREIIDKIVSRVGRRIDESSPMVDARLEDGSRVNAIIPPLALDGPILSIRKFSRDKLQLEQLVERRALTAAIGDTLRAIVRARLNVLIAGGTGCGKTTMLNVLSDFIPAEERIVTIEDAAELQLRQEHVVRLETRPPNVEGKGEVTQRDLVRNSLRMRPDRIILGEVRGAEALDMLQAMNTGHDGSLATIHANSARDAVTRVETMVSMAGLNLPVQMLRHYVSSALDVIVHLTRFSDGSRRLTSLQEIVGMEQDVIVLQEIFAFEQTGLDPDGRVKGRFRATGIRPKFAEHIEAMGLRLAADTFDPDHVTEV